MGCLTMTKLGKLEATPAIMSTMPEVWRMEAMRSTTPAAFSDAPSATTIRTVGAASYRPIPYSISVWVSSSSATVTVSAFSSRTSGSSASARIRMCSPVTDPWISTSGAWRMMVRPSASSFSMVILPEASTSRLDRYVAIPRTAATRLTVISTVGSRIRLTT